MKEYKAIIFDLDGLLIDSERVGIEIAVSAAERLNVPITREVVLATIGITDEDTRNYYSRFVPDEKRLTEFFMEEGRQFAAVISEGKIPLKKGAVRLLDHISAKNLKMAIASSSSRRYIGNVLGPAGVLGYFSVIVSSDDITRGKPDPEAFLTAAQRLNENPQDCLVLEDSLNGMLAALAGGFDCAVIPDLIEFSEQQKSRATYYLNDLDEVIERGLI